MEVPTTATAAMAAMKGKLEGNCRWAPVTPVKTVGGSDSFQNACIRMHQQRGNNCDGTKIAEDCAVEVGSMSFEAGEGNTELGCKLHKEAIHVDVLFQSGLESEKKSKTPESKTSVKRSERNMDLDENTQRKVRMKLKKHRPKVFDEMKPKKPVTPKVVKPKRAKYSPLTVRTKSTRTRSAKPMETDSLNFQVCTSKEVYLEALGDCDKPSCRKRLDLEECLVQRSKVCQVTEVKEKEKSPVGSSFIVYKHYVRRSCRKRLDYNKEECVIQNTKVCQVTEVEQKEKSTAVSSLIVYQRKFRPDHCVQKSRRLGPNFPKIYKKSPMKRQRAIVFDKFAFLKLIPYTRQQRRPEKSGRTSLYHVAKLGKRVGSTRTRKSLKSNTLNSSSLVHSKRKRSKLTSTCRRDFTSFIYDMSKMQFSDAFLRNASTIRSQVTASDQIATVSEVEYVCTKNSTTETVFEPMELPHGNIFTGNESTQNLTTEEVIELMNFSHDDVFSCNESTQSALESSGLILTSKSGLTEPSLEHDILNYLNYHGQNVAVREAMFDFVVQRMECLRINDGNNQLVMRNPNASGSLVPSSRRRDGTKRKKPLPRVDLDPESLEAWNRLMENGGIGYPEPEEDEKAKYWEEQRKLFGGRALSFIACMNLIQGDKTFSPWKGSVVDSVVGVFLTQNVSDHLSSSAYLSLAAKFPAPASSEHMADETSNDYTIPGIPLLSLDETSSDKSKEMPTMKKCPLSTPGDEIKVDVQDQRRFESMPGKQNGKGKQKITIDGDELRKKYSSGISRNRSAHAKDTINWEAVRQRQDVLAKVIMPRGMGNQLAEKIKIFLDRMVREHGSIDLEWLREVPPDKTKEYLLDIYGLGLKSVECLRLLTLHHHAFPIDTNVGRILTRLGWVPIQPLPGNLKLHLLEQYPDCDSIQKYVWPRLCHLDQPTLYECHYQMITFAKVFCTKRQPNCNACPMRGECRHFASAFASSTLGLNGTETKANGGESSDRYDQQQSAYQETPHVFNLAESCSPEADRDTCCVPIIEIPASPRPEPVETIERDIEDFGYYSDDEIPVIKLNSEEFKRNMLSLISSKDDQSKALVAPEVAYIPMRTKYAGRLKTIHAVYEIPDSHPLLKGFDVREPDDPSPYLLAVWTGENGMKSSQEPSTTCSCPDKTACGMFGCHSRQLLEHQTDQIVRGTILIPCRTANRGRFPLNGTYFQVNEVFADHESSQNPIHVPRDWLRNFRTRLLFCGASTSSICSGFTLEQVMYCFRTGFICVREMDMRTRAPRRLSMRFHSYKTSKPKAADDEKLS